MPHIISGLVVTKSPVKHLALCGGCAHEHIATALMEGTAVVEELSIEISYSDSLPVRERKVDTMAAAISQMVAVRVVRISIRVSTFPRWFRASMNRLFSAVDANASITEVELEGALWKPDHSAENFDSLVTAILDCAKLRVLHLTFGRMIRLRQEAKKRFFQALDASTSLTDLQVHDAGSNTFSPDEMHLLEAGGRAERNIELRRFVANPPIYPGRDLLALFLKVEHSLSGQYTLVRNLPADCFRGGKKSDVRLNKRLKSK